MNDDPDEVVQPLIDLRLNLEEVEFLWCLCYSVTKGEIPVHADYARVALAMEPILYRTLQGMIPGWHSPLKATHSN